ncbi:MAG: motility associated factor glycosyltransferase family protein [Brevinematia bacterium]
MELTIVDSKDYKNLKISHDSKTLTIHSLYPFKEAERIATHFNTSMNYVVIAGFGLGYIVEYLLENTKFNIILYEHTVDIIEFAKQHRDLSKVFSSPRLKVFFNTEEMFDFLEKNYIKEFNFYIHRSYITLFPEVYSNFEGLLAAYLSKRHINQNTLKRFQKTWLKNIIKNSIFYFRLPGINNIRHNFSDKPAVIVGAGPSLRKNISVLKEINDRVLIISTDTAFCYLVENDISPDFIVTVDPQDKNSLYISGIKKGNLPFLVADSATSFMTFAKYPEDKIIIFDTIFPLYNELKVFWGEKGYLKSGGSVSTTAFDLARFLGCSPIIFVGQDLAYSGFKTHSDSNILERMLFFTSNKLKNFESYNAKSLIAADRIRVRGNVENFVFTDRKFFTFIDWFKKEIEATDADVINATEGGAYIEGTKVFTLLDTIKSFNILGKFDKKIEVFCFPQKDDRAFLDFLKEMLVTIDNLIPLSRKAIDACKRMLERTENFKNYIERLNDFDFALLKALKSKLSVGRFLELTMQNSIQKLLERGEEKVEISRELIQSWLDFYSEANDGLTYTRHLILKRLNFLKD